jgi:hypothetical protein
VPGAPATGSPTAGPQYEFSEEQNKTFAGVSEGFHLLGLVLILQMIRVGLRFVAGVSYLVTGGGPQVTGGQVLEYAGWLVFLVPLAVWMYRARFSFQAVVETKGSDIDHLMTGLRAMHDSFRWAIGVCLAAFVIGLVAMVLHFAGVM